MLGKRHARLPDLRCREKSALTIPLRPQVTDVRMIMCNKTRRFKGIVYVEFKEVESVPLAMGLTGQKLLGVPIMVQPSGVSRQRGSVRCVRLCGKSDAVWGICVDFRCSRSFQD